MDAPILRFDRYNRTNAQGSLPSGAVWLEITRGRVRQPIRRVQGPVFLIGTAPDCDLVLGDAGFPEAYAYLLVQNETVTVRRVGDGPELLVNGEAVETVELATGDRLVLGPFELTVQIQFPTHTTTLPNSMFSTGNWPWVADFAEV
jgi:hypothetical protein